jgi:N6-L-threonylcarbamoyladenine synthase
VHHLEWHISSIYLEHADIPLPFVALVVSGGHTDLYHCPKRGQYTILGRTRDDAAGECFDKVAKMLHLGYPGGPVIDRLSRHGDPQAISFPRAMRSQNTCDFSFSGLKSAVRSYLLQLTDAHGSRLFCDDTFWPLPEAASWEQQCYDIAASFQQAVVDVLVDKAMRAVEQTRARAAAVVGGVACNSALRRDMYGAGAARACTVFFPSPKFCTDNAAMIACAAYYRYQATPESYHPPTFLDLEANASLTLPGLDMSAGPG